MKMFKYRQNRETHVREKTFFRSVFLLTILMTLMMIIILSLIQSNEESVPHENDEREMELNRLRGLQ
jgi:nitric oxide reductase large subunit